MKRNMLVALGLIVISLVTVFSLQAGASGTTSRPYGANAIAAANPVQQSGAATGGKVTVRLGVSNYAYNPSEIRVKQGSTVRIEGDPGTLVGCMTFVTIPAYGISKRITQADNVIEFVAVKPGTFRISCPMGMGNGKLIVEDGSGNVPPSQEPVVPAGAGHSCGAGGGCGCGG